MTLIRTAFWLSLVVLLLPTDAQQQEKLYKTASDAASQAATFCDRNGKICSKGSEYWGTFQRKLEFGSRLAVDLAGCVLLAVLLLQGCPLVCSDVARVHEIVNNIARVGLGAVLIASGVHILVSGRKGLSLKGRMALVR